MAYNKWWWLVILAKLRIRFHTKDGFSFLKVIGECGYCTELNLDCLKCHLYEKRVCCSIKCLKDGLGNRKKIALWKYIHQMNRGVGDYSTKIDWKEVLGNAITLRDTIKKDAPNTTTG